MPSSGKTQSFGLSQFVQSDKPTWLGDYNGDMSNIDQNAMRKGVYDPEGVAKNAFLATNQKLTGYVKPLAYTEIKDSDSVAQAMGKLEAGTSDLIEQLKGWSVYDSHGQLGMTPGEESDMGDIFRKMPDKSVFLYGKATANASEAYPMTTGMLELKKVNDYRATARFDYYNGSIHRSWEGFYRIDVTPQWSGWLEVGSLSGTWIPELVDVDGNEAEDYLTRRGRWIITGDLVRLDYLIELSDKGELSTQLIIPVPSELNASVSPYLSDRGSLRMTRATVPVGFAYAESVFLNSSVIRLDYYYVNASNVLALSSFTGDNVPDNLQCYGNITLKRG